MEIDVKKILMFSSKLNNLLDGFDEFYLSKKTNLTIKDKVLVFLLDKNLSPFELIKLLGIAKSNLALILTKLEKEKLIIKKHDFIDKRNILISLTLEGQNKANEVLNKISKSINNNLAYKKNAEELNVLIEELNNKITI